MWRIAVALALLATSAFAEEPARRPHVLLLMADQWRGDALGCAGHPAVRTPRLDRLASEGCNFVRAYSSAPSCTPARAALLTGMSPWGHGMLGYARVAARYPVELPRLFGAAGYRTHVVGKNHFSPQRNLHGWQSAELDESGRVETPDFESDYRKWFRTVAPDRDPDATGIGWNDYRARSYALPENLHPTRWTGDRAVAFLETHDVKRPFLLKVSFARPHSPYDPPPRLLDLYKEAKIPPAFVGAWSAKAFGALARPQRFTAARNNLGPKLTRASRAAYYANITFIDEEIGRILNALRARGVLENTLVVFFGDHGDMLGDHHLWRKAYAYEGSARVPMIVRWGSEFMKAPRGTVRREPVEIRDVLPTLLDAASLAIPDAVEGKSLLRLVRGETKGWREVLDLEHATTYWPGNAWTALTDGRFKYIFHAFDGSEQLFDLDADPGETKDLAAQPDHAARLTRWRARMAKHLAPRGETWVADGKPAIRKKRIALGPNYPR
ncbi:MAG: arylsulfatase [Planctomycetota bacterium]|nr:arylsulfatase [Planctomycetota bacterium]